MKFRKKPVEVEAWDVHELLAFEGRLLSDLPEEIREAYERGALAFARFHILIKTSEGLLRAGTSDKVICGRRGELYLCKADIFAETYEEVRETETDPDKETEK